MRSQDEAVRRLIAEQAAQWHVVNSQGELDPQQSREFMRWLRTSPVHVAEYLTIAGLARDLAAVASENRESLDDVLAAKHEPVRLPVMANTADATNRDGKPSLQNHRVRRRHRARPGGGARRKRLRRGALAATLVLVAGAAFLASSWFASRPTVRTFATRHGQMRSLKLPDGSVMKLDSDSAVTIGFNRTARRVTVDRGQVFFKVVDDPQRPFSVRVGSALIRDIGTTFDVYRRARNTTITVATGHVQVWHVAHTQPRGWTGRWLPWLESEHEPQGTMLVQIGPGQQVKVDKGGQVASLARVDVPSAFAWMRGRIVFDNQTVASIATEFNRYNGVKINVKSHRVGALRISGAFDANSVSSFTAFLGSLPGVETRRHGQVVDVYAGSHARRHHE